MENSEKQSLLIDLHYLPCIEYFSYLMKSDEIIFENNEYFIKQTYRNRAYILGANKVESLIIPVQDGNKKILVKDIKIDFNENWQKKHWRTITSAYNKSPFFEYFSDDFKIIYESKQTFLWDFNFDLLTLCLKILRINKPIRLTERHEKTYESCIFDARNAINSKNKPNQFQHFISNPYTQNFGNEFVPNLSIIDLLFCQGNRSTEILKKSLAF